jgi:hypothetical protein
LKLLPNFTDLVDEVLEIKILERLDNVFAADLGLARALGDLVGLGSDHVDEFDNTLVKHVFRGAGDGFLASNDLFEHLVHGRCNGCVSWTPRRA